MNGILKIGRKISWIVLLLAGLQLSAQQSKWQQQADYTLTVALNTDAKTLDGNLQLKYTNHSPDTLSYIWFHLWPNAYKNDKTAYSEQQLKNRSTAFYFSGAEDKGYINRLDFKANNLPATYKDHPLYIDVVQLMLPEPLLPGSAVDISTPFHVQLPYRFSRLGHAGDFFSITQWFPKAAVYDEKGWHEMPYLDMGEFYADFGNYDVTISLPENFVVAATGVLQNETEKQWLLSKRSLPFPKAAEKAVVVKKWGQPAPKTNPTPKQTFPAKTIQFKAENVIDFAWFAHPDYRVDYDTILLDNRTIEVWNYILPQDADTWKHSLDYTKKALRHYASEAGPYQYPQVSVVCDPVSTGSGMEYPMITSLNTFAGDSLTLEELIVHEVGHNWFQAMMASNERDFPWMDEGFNTYLERKYFKIKKEASAKKQKNTAISIDYGEWMLNLMSGKRIDPPILTPSAEMTEAGYNVVAYTKTALWLEDLENKLGKDSLTALMKQYYLQFAMRHPGPDDFKAILAAKSPALAEQTEKIWRNTGPVDSASVQYLLLQKTGMLKPGDLKKKVSIWPAFGFNQYDKFQIGMLLHNYTVPQKAWQWVAVPLFATGSSQLTGYGRLSYTHYPKKGPWHHLEWFTGVARFNRGSVTGTDDQKIFSGFTKFVPGVYMEKRKSNYLSTQTRWLEIKSWIIREQGIEFTTPEPPGDTVFFPRKAPATTLFIPQVSVGWKNDRVLYPYSLLATVQQVKDLARLTLEGTYFFNYDATGKGIRARAFAGKIFYLREKTEERRIDNSRYHFTMYAPNGTLDYTYSQPFAERNQSAEIFGRQIGIRDGGFKYRSDFSSVRPGLSNQGLDFFDNWLASVNLEFDIPDKYNPLSILPFEVPLKIYADVGTSASPWRTESEHSRFLYSIGLHLPVAKALKIYFPVFQSTDFKEPNSVNDPNRPGGASLWQRRLTFTLDLNALKPQILGVPLIR